MPLGPRFPPSDFHSSTKSWWRGITEMIAASPPRSLCRLSPV
jgi:hypothetical protein